MQFQLGSLSFLFVFLPVCLLCYVLTPKRLKNACLLLFSLAFLALSGWMSLLIACGSVLTDYGLGLLLRRLSGKEKTRRVLLIFGICKDLLLFFGFLVRKQIAGLPVLPGIRVYPLLSIGYLLQINQTPSQTETNLIDFSLGSLFFVRMPAGPLGSWNQLRLQLKSREISLEKSGEGLVLFVRGLAKKVLLADGLLSLFTELSGFKQELSVLAVWAMLLFLSLGVYFLLSGYSDMARGLGRVFGFELPVNFYEPFRAGSMYEFFSRFNMTVTRFVRRHVYFRLGGESNSTVSSMLNLLLTSMLLSLWFGVSPNFLAWGIDLGLIMIVERVLLQKLLRKLPPFFKRLYTICLVFLSFAFFGASTLAQSFDWITVMFGIGSPEFVSSSVLYLFSRQWVLPVIGVFAATSLPKRLSSFLRSRYQRAFSILSTVWYGMLLLVVITMIAFAA